MFTVCPKCTLTLAVTATDLRLGQGYVRCGRCSNVFNALLRLTEALGDADAASAAPPQADPASTAQIRQALSSAALSASSRPAITPKPPPASRPAATPAPTTARSAARPATAPTPAAPPPAAVSAAGAVSARRETDFDAIGQFEQVLQTLGISLLEEEPVPPSSALPPPVAAMDELDAMTRRLAAATGEAADTNTDTDTDTDTDAAVHSDVIEFDLLDADAGDQARRAPGSHEHEHEHEHVTDSAVDLDIPGFRRAARRWPWALGCVVLAPLLVLQVLDHWRTALAASSTWGAPTTQVYALLGIPLRPHWDLGAYDVHQQGAEADSGSSQVIHVRLSLANRAARPQPTPLLRLTLLDRYGKRIAQRDLTPAEYWPKGHTPQRFLASDELAVRDPSAASASFELDVCLRDSGGTVRCAGDSTPLASAAIP